MNFSSISKWRLSFFFQHRLNVISNHYFESAYILSKMYCDNERPTRPPNGQRLKSNAVMYGQEESKNQHHKPGTEIVKG